MAKENRVWQPFSAEELVTIWYYVTLKKKTVKWMVRHIGRTTSSYNTALVKMRQTLRGTILPRTPEWQIARDMIKNGNWSAVMSFNNAPTNGVGTTEVKTNDPLAKLESLFQDFSQGLVEVIDQEAKRRSEKEVQDLRVKYEAELRRMQEVLVEAQNSSVVGLLRKKWSQQ